ncbi:MAG: histidinol dehydrogenase [Firmicutes bacterium]|nr:histidinol dehydrogenase [Bacillota bacterium]
MLKIIEAGAAGAFRAETPALQRNNDVEAAVDRILKDIQERGDAALLEYTARFDGAVLESSAVTKKEMDEAWEAVEPEFRAILEEAAEHIRRFHQNQVKEGFRFQPEEGIILGQKVIPLASAGLYIPGGTACYPSSVLMNAIPPKLAGVQNLVLATPPGKDGKVPAVILCAARIAGVDHIYKMGGAQAIGALAFGTETVPKVDKIVGPGNMYVATAKRRVFGVVDIDMIAGPSEILVLADGTCNPKYVAADLLSQAEHDAMSSAVLITDSRALVEAVQQELEVQLAALPREAIARKAIENNSFALLVNDLEEGVEYANQVAPEHLEICTDDPWPLLEKVRNAGSVFLGKNAPEALGDYWAGPNHVLPTSGTARFSSPLSVDDFVKRTSFTYYSREALKKSAKSIETFAEREGLSAHARSVTVRFAEEE